MNVICYKCRSDLELRADQDISRYEECPSCYAILKCCKMCEFYDTHSYNDCSEPAAHRVDDKEKANYCSLFRLAGNKNMEQYKNDIIANANALFKK